MNAQTEDSRAHWRDQVESLTAQIATAEGAIEVARIAASAAALEGGDLDAATRELAHARDRADALRSAMGEARRHLAQADAAHAQRERDRALARAQTIARKRIEIAESIDEYLSALDPLITQWVAAGGALARELDAAGVRTPSRETLTGAHRIRGAAWARAGGFMHAIEAARVSPDHRVPLRQISAAQAAPVLTKESKNAE